MASRPRKACERLLLIFEHRCERLEYGQSFDEHHSGREKHKGHYRCPYLHRLEEFWIEDLSGIAKLTLGLICLPMSMRFRKGPSSW